MYKNKTVKKIQEELKSQTKLAAEYKKELDQLRSNYSEQDRIHNLKVNEYEGKLKDLRTNYIEERDKVETAELEKKVLEKKNEDLSSELEGKQTELEGVQSELETITSEYDSATNQITKLKEPFSAEALQELVGASVDETYQEIKTAIVEHFSQANASLSVYESEHGDQTLVEILKENGIKSGHGVHLGVEFAANNYWIRKDNKNEENVSGLVIDFEDSQDYTREEHSGYFRRSFAHTEEEKHYNISFSLHCDKNNVYIGRLMEDAELFVKAALIGKVKSLMEEGKYSIAAEVIENNQLQEPILPYIQRNADNKEMIAYFASIVGETK